MKKTNLIVWIIIAVTSQKLISQNAPISTVGTIITSGTTATVPIMTTNFINIGSCNLKLLYNPAVVTATAVTTGPGVGGGISANLTVAGVISLGWYTYPGKTLPDNTVIFNISFTKVTAGTSAITFSDNGSSCIWYDGNWNPLNDIPTENYYITGSVTFIGSLVADFMASNTTPPKNSTVLFTDLTTGGPTSWEWSFNRTSVNFVNGTTPASQNPQVQFTEGGFYTVTLVVHNPGNTDTKVKTDYILAGIPGLWTGITSSAWLTTTNWDNWVIPVSSTDVTIPSSAPFWPEYSGDQTMGVTCKSITLNGSSEATINGNFTINPGYSLNFTGNGTLRVSGNWINAGIFNALDGTIEFIGTGPSSILTGGSPPVINEFNNLTESKTGAVLTIVPDIIVNGNLTLSP